MDRLPVQMIYEHLPGSSVKRRPDQRAGQLYRSSDCGTELAQDRLNWRQLIALVCTQLEPDPD